ncbi:hypothetical protein ACFVVX_10750 [Kitasatospora sp. NPDC058170]|uniref:hypothetical protein n=1 Tax=Kitasatospora sp. NPDC058170 TaxID=3346364 RepID=UPI0036DA0DB8
MTTDIARAQESAFTASLDAILAHHRAFMTHATLISDTGPTAVGAFVNHSVIYPLPNSNAPVIGLNRQFPDAPDRMRRIWGELLEQLNVLQRKTSDNAQETTRQFGKDGDQTAWRRSMGDLKRELAERADRTIGDSCGAAQKLARDNPKWGDYILSWAATVVNFATNVLAAAINLLTYAVNSGAKQPDRTVQTIEGFFVHSCANVDHWVFSHLVVIERPESVAVS